MKGNPEERAIALRFFWLRELDLNQRPSGYKCAPVLFFCFALYAILARSHSRKFPQILLRCIQLHKIRGNIGVTNRLFCVPSDHILSRLSN